MYFISWLGRRLMVAERKNDRCLRSTKAVFGNSGKEGPRSGQTAGAVRPNCPFEQHCRMAKGCMSHSIIMARGKSSIRRFVEPRVMAFALNAARNPDFNYFMLLSVHCSFFDQSCDFLRPGDINSVTGACDFNLMAPSSLGIPPLQVGIDSSIFGRY
jgi:hypothetical protein